MTELDTQTVQEVLDIVPDHPLASLYDVACLYAACDVYDRYTSDYADSDLSAEALRAMSPEKLESLFNPEADNSLIAARVDLSGSSPRIADPPVSIENLTEEMKYKVGFMSRKKTARQTDYSISNLSNGDDVETLAHDTWGNRFLRGRLERWPFEVADEVVSEYPVLQALRTLGGDTDTMERLEQGLIEQATFDETEALMTVKIKLEDDDEFRYPGEIEPLNEAGVSNRFEHLRDGLSVSDAHGEGTGFVSGESGEVLGGSTGVRGQYGKLQQGRFPNMQGSDAWLSRPLKEAQAAAITTFDGFVSEFSFTRNGVRLHYLPYPIQIVDSETFDRFYNDVYQPLRQADESEYIDRLIEIYTADVQENEATDHTDSLADIVDEPVDYQQFSATDSWLRLYGLMYVGSTDPSRVFVDEPNLSLDSLTELEETYLQTLADVGNSAQFGQIATQLGYYLPTQGGFAYAVMFGSFFEPVTASSADPDDNAGEQQATTTDDALFSRYARLLRGSPLQIRSLLDEYVTRLDREFRGNQQGGRSPFPVRAVLAQYIQLRSLDAAGLLRGGSIITPGICTGNMDSAGEEVPYESREKRLEDFLDNHPVLDDDETQSVFLLGALVGRLSAYQYNEDVSRKLTEQYPPSSINRRSIPDVTQEVLDRNLTYGDKDEIASFNRRYTDRLTDSMLAKSPSEWELSESETKWVYALGVTYGKQDTSEGIEREDNTSESANKTDDQPTITEFNHEQDGN